jgi:peptide deformylase
MEDVSATMSRLSDAERAERGRVELPLTCLVNPLLQAIGERRATFFEGCLSVGGYMALVERHLDVGLSGVDADGKKVELELHGWPARIAQHELDHLDGTLYVDRMLTRSLCENGEMKARYVGRTIEEIRAALKV